jgi:hypothetical protein
MISLFFHSIRGRDSRFFGAGSDDHPYRPPGSQEIESHGQKEYSIMMLGFIVKRLMYNYKIITIGEKENHHIRILSYVDL